MSDKPSTARHLNRSVTWLAIEAEQLATVPDCERCGAPAAEAHNRGGRCQVDPPYTVEQAESLCRQCHTETGCPRPPQAPGENLRWP